MSNKTAVHIREKEGSDSTKSGKGESNKAERSGKTPASPSSSSVAAALWPFWNRNSVETSSSAVSPSADQQLSVGCPPPFDPANASGALVNGEMNGMNSNSERRASKEIEEYGKASLRHLDTMHGDLTDTSRNADVTKSITDSIRQLLLEASKRSTTSPSGSPSRSRFSKGVAVTDRKIESSSGDTYVSEGVLRLLKSVETLSKYNLS